MITGNFKLVILITTIALAMIIPSTFAVESFPNWSTHQTVPNGWGCSDNCYADSNSNGVNYLYAKSNGIVSINNAIVHNNAKWSPIITTDVLGLTTNNLVTWK